MVPPMASPRIDCIRNTGAIFCATLNRLFAPTPLLFAWLACLLTGMKGKQHETN